MTGRNWTNIKNIWASSKLYSEKKYLWSKLTHNSSLFIISFNNEQSNSRRKNSINRNSKWYLTLTRHHLQTCQYAPGPIPKPQSDPGDHNYQEQHYQLYWRVTSTLSSSQQVFTCLSCCITKTGCHILGEHIYRNLLSTLLLYKFCLLFQCGQLRHF